MIIILGDYFNIELSDEKGFDILLIQTAQFTKPLAHGFMVCLVLFLKEAMNGMFLEQSLKCILTASSLLSMLFTKLSDSWFLAIPQFAWYYS